MRVSVAQVARLCCFRYHIVNSQYDDMSGDDMGDNPQRPTERIAFYEVLTSRLSSTMGNPAHTVFISQGEQPRVAMTVTRTPLWFDADEDVEIESPADESPDYDE